MKSVALLLALLNFNTSMAAVVEPLVKWSKSEIKVCFLDQISQMQMTNRKVNKDGELILKSTEFSINFLSPKEQTVVETTLQKEYSQAETGIYFTGWKKCSETPSPDVIVLKAENSNPYLPRYGANSDLGQGGIFDDETGFSKRHQMVPSVVFVEILPHIVAHEFGHIAGLRHEIANNGSENDSQCQAFFLARVPEQNRQSADARKMVLDFKGRVESMFSSTKSMSEFDQQSIMNMCASAKHTDMEAGSFLSPLDKKALKELYPIEK